MATELLSAQNDHDSLVAEIKKLKWHHSINFGNGIITPGQKIEREIALADIYFQDGIAGKSVLDIGCWDGYYSVEASRRGASRVLATDHYVWANFKSARKTIELARKHLAPDIEIRDIDVPDITPASVGKFDVVLFLNVFYHLRHPFLMLERIAPIAEHMLVLATYMDAPKVNRPAMIFYPGTELAGGGGKGDPTNWWGPNRLCVEAMLRDVGFKTIRFTPEPFATSRGVFQAFR